jgi:hypothetical protein
MRQRARVHTQVIPKLQALAPSKRCRDALGTCTGFSPHLPTRPGWSPLHPGTLYLAHLRHRGERGGVAVAVSVLAPHIPVPHLPLCWCCFPHPSGCAATAAGSPDGRRCIPVQCYASRVSTIALSGAALPLSFLCWRHTSRPHHRNAATQQGIGGSASPLRCSRHLSGASAFH